MKLGSSVLIAAIIISGVRSQDVRAKNAKSSKATGGGTKSSKMNYKVADNGAKSSKMFRSKSDGKPEKASRRSGKSFKSSKGFIKSDLIVNTPSDAALGTEKPPPFPSPSKSPTMNSPTDSPVTQGVDDSVPTRAPFPATALPIGAGLESLSPTVIITAAPTGTADTPATSTSSPLTPFPTDPPVVKPYLGPTGAPTPCPEEDHVPTPRPSRRPTKSPSNAPTARPSIAPSSLNPTENPSLPDPTTLPPVPKLQDTLEPTPNFPTAPPIALIPEEPPIDVEPTPTFPTTPPIALIPEEPPIDDLDAPPVNDENVKTDATDDADPDDDAAADVNIDAPDDTDHTGQVPVTSKGAKASKAKRKLLAASIHATSYERALSGKSGKQQLLLGKSAKSTSSIMSGGAEEEKEEVADTNNSAVVVPTIIASVPKATQAIFVDTHHQARPTAKAEKYETNEDFDVDPFVPKEPLFGRAKTAKKEKQAKAFKPKGGK